MVLFRTYIAELEFIKDTSKISAQQLGLVKKQVILLKTEKENLKEIINLRQETIKTLKEKISDIKKEHKKELNKEKRKSFFNGLLYGGIGGFIVCLLLV